jgi:iron complex outermembrane recepter protein
VNGVINIITKRATATTGGQVSVAAGNELRNATQVRWGAASNERMAYRVWGKFDYRTPAFDSPGYFRFDDQFTLRDPSIRNLDSGTGRAGFRLDGQAGEHDQWLVQGDGYMLDRQDATAYAVLAPLSMRRLQEHTDYEGGDLQAKWTHTGSAGNESELQFTYSRNDWNYEFLAVHLNNLTVDYQKRVQTGEYNEIYWGAGYQRYWDDTRAGSFAQFTPSQSNYHNGDFVLRDEWQVVPDRWTISAGVRLDYGSYRRLEYQPSVRLLFTPSPKASAWLAVSRAVRTPSRLDRDAELSEGMMASQPFPSTATLLGSSQFRSEVERSLEGGYRIQSGQRWSIDVSAFWSYYGRLRLIESPFPPPLVFAPGPVFSLRFTMANGGSSRSYGGEIWGSFQVQRRWKLIPSYSYMNEARWLPATEYFQYAWDGTPASLPHQASLRSQHDLSRTVQFDLMARVRSRDNWLNLPGALLLAARLSWRPVRGGELSLTARNLTNRKTVESYADMIASAIPLRRTFAAGWTQRF